MNTDRRNFLKNSLTLAALMLLAKLHAAASPYAGGSSGTVAGDLLFPHVKLYDGTGKPPFMADVAVKGDKIVAVAPTGTFNRTGSTVIDGRGKALVPGFADVHTHSDSALYRVPGADSKIMQGVTTDISGNCGTSYYLAGAKGVKDELRKVYGNFSAYLDLVEKASPAVNCAHLCGHNSLRIHVMGYADRRPTAEEMRRMKELLADALNNGAAKFNIRGRGVVAPGFFADLVLLDLDNFDSKADFLVVNRVPTGIDSVYVNGQLAYSPDPEIKTVRAGRVLRIK